MLYWAYGSNLNAEHMRQRCPRAEKIGPLAVDNAALVFRGVADVVVRRGSLVPGGLWRITRRCEEALDRYEGVASRLYLKRYLLVQSERGQPEDCLFYQMRTHVGVMPPSERYLKTIVRGYRDFGLDLDVLDRYLAEAWGDKKLTPMLRQRHWAKGSPALARGIAP